MFAETISCPRRVSELKNSGADRERNKTNLYTTRTVLSSIAFCDDESVLPSHHPT